MKKNAKMKKENKKGLKYKSVLFIFYFEKIHNFM